MIKKQRRGGSVMQVIAIGFFLLILAGTALLCLPVSSRARRFTPISDAAFTATSAVCVTGLVVVDTGSYWSAFGQAVILCLIQIGGLGFMTIATQFYLLMRRKIGLRARETLSESISSTQLGGVVRLSQKIVAGTALIEGAGAVLLALRFCPQFGLGRGLWFAVFHSVSAFCNAGFDLLGGVFEPYCSFVHYAADPLVILTLSALIIVGGIGFVVWDDVTRFGLHWKRYHLHSKLVLVTSALLLGGGTLLFWLLERSATSAGMRAGGQLLAALFDAVTPRTAGFNAVPTDQLSNGGKLLTIMLMHVGGSPGSTAGGVKTTTWAVLVLYAVSYVKNRPSFGMFGRRLDPACLHRASVVLALNLLLPLFASMLIAGLEPIPLTDVLFEAFSAIGTVGMTTGITRALGPVSRVALMLLMYLGRVGSVSFAFALAERKAPPRVTNPVEQITIG